MSERPLHPSFLALDRLALGLDEEEALSQHVASCPRCAAHIAELRRGPVHPRQERSQLARALRAWPARARRHRWSVGAAGALAVAAALVLTLAPEAEQPVQTAFTTRRGAPSVALYVKRESQVSLWDEKDALRPHDRVRLEITPDGFTHVGVFAGSDEASPRLLYSAPIAPEGASALPKAWEVDDAPEPEVLRVVLARQPVNATTLVAGVDADVWVRTLTLEKQPSVTTGSDAEEPAR